MKSLTSPLRVHIAPVGAEVDRVVLPLKLERADRVYLITRSPVDRRPDFLHDIIKKVDKMGIERRMDSCDMFELEDVIKTIGSIVLKEREEGNNVFINISSSSTIAGIGCWMVTMIWGGKPYYVFPKKWTSVHGGDKDGPMTMGIQDKWDIEIPQIKRPDKDLIRCLSLINKGKGTRKRELIERLVEEDLIEGGKQKLENKEMLKLHRYVDERFIRPLLEWGFIEIEGRTRARRISLTEAGKRALVMYEIEINR